MTFNQLAQDTNISLDIFKTDEDSRTISIFTKNHATPVIVIKDVIFEKFEETGTGDGTLFDGTYRHGYDNGKNTMLLSFVDGSNVIAVWWD